jgi:hypothetical protein
MLQIVASLTDDSTGIIYNRNIFTMQATDENTKKLSSKLVCLSLSSLSTLSNKNCQAYLSGVSVTKKKVIKH